MQFLSSRNTLFSSGSDIERQLYKTILKYGGIDRPRAYLNIEENIERIGMKKRQGFLIWFAWPFMSYCSQSEVS